MRATESAALEQFAAQCARGWLVGGCLRDALLGLAVRDLDLVVDGDPLALARAVADAGGYALAVLRPDAARLVPRGAAGTWLDISRLRGPTIAADLALRDFRINALALPLERRAAFLATVSAPADGAALVALEAALLDPLGGLADLRARR
ncbi:MAG: hypothetical protein ACRDHE_01925, partial [Ktedonobacterales bacterium]